MKPRMGVVRGRENTSPLAATTRAEYFSLNDILRLQMRIAKERSGSYSPGRATAYISFAIFSAKPPWYRSKCVRPSR